MRYTSFVDDVFAILAEPTRRRMLDVLRAGERSVTELVEEFDIHQPGISRHLRILHDAGLVSVRKDAQRRIYSVRPEPLKDLDTWLDQYRDLWERRLDKLAAHVERRKTELKEQEGEP